MDDAAPRSSAGIRLDEAFEAARPSGRLERIFGTRDFFRLWIAQVVSATGDWQSRFTLDAQALLRIGATTQRPGELTVTVSNPTNGYRTGEISFDLASKRAEVDEFLRRCEGFRRAAAA